jgi:predicted nuclease of predicted toxin-antitoxin system
MAYARGRVSTAVKVLLDMNLSPLWVQFLTDEGMECAHWSKIGDPRATDAQIMKWARDNQFVLFTNDMDFGALLAATHAKGPSVLQARVKDTMPDSIGRDVVRVLLLRQRALERGALVTIDPARARVRVLPIGDGDTDDEGAG